MRSEARINPTSGAGWTPSPRAGTASIAMTPDDRTRAGHPVERQRRSPRARAAARPSAAPHLAVLVDDRDEDDDEGEQAYEVDLGAAREIDLRAHGIEGHQERVPQPVERHSREGDREVREQAIAAHAPVVEEEDRHDHARHREDTPEEISHAARPPSATRERAHRRGRACRRAQTMCDTSTD